MEHIFDKKMKLGVEWLWFLSMLIRLEVINNEEHVWYRDDSPITMITVAVTHEHTWWYEDMCHGEDIYPLDLSNREKQ